LKAIELVGPSKRVLASNSIYFFFIIGQYFILLFGYLVREYQNLVILYSCLVTIFVVYFWYNFIHFNLDLIYKKLFQLIRYIPESPRWLLLNKKRKKAVAIFETIAVSNKKDLSNCYFLNRLINDKKQVPKLFTIEKNIQKDVININNLTTIKTSKYVINLI
jgi:hypothetical protein